MSNRIISVSKSCKLNRESISSKDNPEYIYYLDTGNITQNKIDNLQYLTAGNYPSRAKRKVKDNTIIYSTVRPNQEHFGIIKNPDKNLIVSTGFTTIDVIDNNLDPLYLYYSLTRKEITNFLQSIAENSVSSYPSINSDDIGKLQLKVPVKKEEQKKIVAVLSALDNKIELNNLINTELENLAKTIYDYWFVQFDFPDKNGKPYKASGGKMVYNQELKRTIPQGWEVVEIENILEGENNSIKIPSKEFLTLGKYPVIDQSKDFICGFTNTLEAVIKTDRPRIIFGDHTRILKLINFDFARGADGTQVLLSNNERLPQHLLYYSLLKIDLTNYGYARHFKFLKQSKILLPNIEVARKFEEIAYTNHSMIKNNILQNQQLTQLRDWLLPMLMNGQVTVK